MHYTHQGRQKGGARGRLLPQFFEIFTCFPWILTQKILKVRSFLRLCPPDIVLPPSVRKIVTFCSQKLRNISTYLQKVWNFKEHPILKIITALYKTILGVNLCIVLMLQNIYSLICFFPKSIPELINVVILNCNSHHSESSSQIDLWLKVPMSNSLIF